MKMYRPRSSTVNRIPEQPSRAKDRCRPYGFGEGPAADKKKAIPVLLRIFLGLTILVAIRPQARASCSVQPAHLRLQSLSDPIGVTVPSPRFSWWLAASNTSCQNMRQVAYRIVVTTSAASLVRGETLWDSGKILSSCHTDVTYSGVPLTSSTLYFWRVETWDNRNIQGFWSTIEHWTTGLMRAEDWHASWIGAGPDEASTEQSREGVSLPETSPVPMPIFRKSFSLPAGKIVRRALVSVSGLGQYELHLNGRNVTSDVFQPGWTDYRKHVLYNTYDVGPRLHAGTNVFGLLLGNGMYNSPRVAGRYAKFTGTFGQPKLILQMDIFYTDGMRDRIVSDSSWSVTAGPLRFSSPYGGEDVDARYEPEGWDRNGFDDRTWSSAMLVSGPGGVLESQMQPPVREQNSLWPVRISSPSPGTWVYDFGRNHAGWPLLRVQGTAGAKVTLVPGELLDDHGAVIQSNVIWNRNTSTSFSYTLRGGRPETWHPRFTYWGYRYLQVTGARPSSSPKTTEQTRILAINSQPIHAAVKQVGTFTTSDKLLMRIHRLILGAILSNTMSLLTDCPTREKLGWLEQTYLAGGSILYNFDDQLLYQQVAEDMQDAQLADGMIPGIAPEYVAFIDRNGVNTDFRDSPEWGSAVVLATWEAYRFFGDRNVLAEHYLDMRRYLDYLDSRSQRGLIRYGLGDWYDLGPGRPGVAQLTDRSLTATATYVHALDLFSKIAAMLGYDQDVALYATRAQSVRESFQSELFHPVEQDYDRGSQTANAMALATGMVPAEDREGPLNSLLRDIEAHHDKTTAGDIGFHYVLTALADGGRSDIVYRMLTQTALPGYGYQLAHGATTLTEAWDADSSSSQDHLMLGHAEEWFYRSLAGLDFDMSRPEPRQILIHPAILTSVSAASASLKSVLGPIYVAWRRHQGVVSLNIEIPSGTCATVVLPRDAVAHIPVGFTIQPADPLSNSREIILGSGWYFFHWRTAYAGVAFTQLSGPHTALR
jgi:alpha-L-rhamnosidase